MPDKPPRRARVQRVSAAFNAAALAMVLLVFALWDPLFHSWQPRPSTLPVERPASRVVLVVIDGLRADVAEDPLAMPALNGLAAAGARTRCTVQSLIPSTIAGIRGLVEGVVSPPGEFVLDFASLQAAGGGVLELVHGQGRDVFVAGPELWRDRYGDWIDAGFFSSFDSGDDARVLEAGLQAVRSGEHELVVIHFGALDWAAHGSGSESEAYTRRAGWADGAIRAIATAAGRRTAMVVTSDHGVTVQGGHAGNEADVVQTPLVVAWPGVALRDPAWQTDVPWLMAALLGIDGVPRVEREPSTALALVGVTAACLGIPLALGVAATTFDEEQLGWRPFTLSAALWLTLAAALALGPIASACAIAALALGARPPFRGAAIAMVGVLGITLGVARVAQAAMPEWWWSVTIVAVTAVAAERAGAFGPLAWSRLRAPAGERLTLAVLAAAGALGGVELAAVVVGAFGVSRWACFVMGDQRARVVWCGALAATLHAAALLALGESVSLSTITVGPATELIPLPLGVVWAGMAVVGMQALPLVAIVLGARPLLTTLSPVSAGAWAAGFATVALAQAAVGTAVLGLVEAQAVRALGLGLLLRSAGELTLCGVACGAVLLTARHRRAAAASRVSVADVPRAAQPAVSPT